MTTQQTGPRENKQPEQRQHFLHHAAYKSLTIKKYFGNVRKFIGYTQQQGWNITTAEEMDAALTEYLHDLYIFNDGKGRSGGEAALHGVEMLLRRYKGKLTSARLALKGWSNLRPTKSFPPLPRDLMTAVAVQAMRGHGFPIGLAIVLAFDCLLRISEVDALQVDDITKVKGPTGATQVVIRIKFSKTGKNQLLTVRCSHVAQLLLDFARTRRGKLFAFNAKQFRTWFKDACYQLGLRDGYVPHSLRHGGATELLTKGHDIERILERGRWASNNSARRYLQEGKAHVLYASAPQRVREWGKLFADNILATFSLFPIK